MKDNEKEEQEETDPIYNNSSKDQHNSINATEEERPKSQLEVIGSLLVEYFAIIEHYIHAICSLSLACFVIYYTNFFEHLFNDPRVLSIYFNLAIISLSIIIILFCYVSLILPFKKSEEEIDETFTKLAPFFCIIGLVGIIALINCIWNIYYYYSIGIVLVIVWGFIMSANFAPNGKIGNLFFVSIAFAALMSGKYINHKGHTYY